MYVVTFYSFKGGVGRSMALMNCAAHLVQQGKRVLLVDFDLEAPGLDTFDLKWKKSKTNKGLVDYVIDYLNAQIAPELDAYVQKGSFSKKDRGDLWLMSSGERNANYHQRLNSINWKNLYDFNDGFLLFENLKAQWKKSLKPDYVLVDSRTGHTDVSGICTRQLADAVVVLFFPNKQNLSGLVPIVKRIRKEKEIRNKEIKLHFVPSNIPESDDEHSILGDSLLKFESQLEYDKFAAKIHHYQDLSLLNQDISVVSRPNSRLVFEFLQLVQEIQKYNEQDPTGVMFNLEGIITGPNGIRNFDLDKLEKIDEYVQRVSDYHSNSFEVVDLVVRYLELRDEFQAFQLLKEGWEKFSSDPLYLIRYARLATRVGQKEESRKSAITATKVKYLSHLQLIETVRLLLSQEKDPDAKSALESILSWASVDRLGEDELLHLAREFNFHSHRLKIAEKLLRRSIQLSASNSNSKKEQNFKPENELVLNLIGQGKFDSAIELSESLRSNSDYEWDITSAFNLAMAIWGKAGETPVEAFKSIVESFNLEQYDNTNYYQCLSLAYWALSNNKKAQQYLDDARKSLKFSEFSSWSYLQSYRAEFEKDLSEQQQLLNGEDIKPRVFASTKT